MMGAILRRSVAIFDASAGLRLNGARVMGLGAKCMSCCDFSDYVSGLLSYR